MQAASADRPWLSQYEPGVPPDFEVPEITVPGFLVDSARRFPRNPAMILAGPGFHSTFSYAQLDALSNRFANALIQHGLQPGDRVGLQLPNLPHYPIAYYGVLKAGGIAVQINPLYRGRDLEFVLRDSGAKIVITLTRLLDSLKEARAGTDVSLVVAGRVHDYFPALPRWLYGLRRARAAGDVLPPEADAVSLEAFVARGAARAPKTAPQPSDIAVLQYTGGTTGVPKAAVLTHRNLVANAVQARLWQTDLVEGRERLISCVPFFHSYGMSVCLNKGVYIGAALIMVLQRMFEPRAVAEACRTLRPTLFPGVPAMYLAISQLKNVQRYNLSSIRVCVSGASPLPVAVKSEFERLTGGKLVEGYGLSEASPVTHANPVYGVNKPGSIGLPLPGTDAAIVDLESGTRFLGPGEIGELVIRGPQVMQGYWKNEIETRIAIRRGWLHTGDIAKMDEDGFFYIVDRKKDMANIAGFKVYPREIEEVLYEHPQVSEAAVAGVAHPIRGETLVAHVVLKSSAGRSAREWAREIRDFCRERLADYKVPRRVDIVDAIPKSLIGKPLRREVRSAASEVSREDSD
jgi:long-chain acyl-CoA synthetase